MRPIALVTAALVVAVGCRPSSSLHTYVENGPPFSSETVAAGDSVYRLASCTQCQGQDASGTANGPSLRGPVWKHINGSYNDLVRIINTGIPRQQIMDPAYRLAMPARGGVPVLSNDDIRVIAAYIYTISRR
jgi:hypothetical protein